MGALFFVCPTTGDEIITGLEIDPATYNELPEGLADIKCPECGLLHNLFQLGARLLGEETDAGNAR